MTDQELNDKFARLVDAQLRFQDQLGEMARLMREDREDRQRRQAEEERINQEFRQRMEENEQRFNVLLEEIRYLPADCHRRVRVEKAKHGRDLDSPKN
ncbi:MAG: hypothetical protein HC921_09870 [Synechococcaceae cyanobacterium SM2_3_1]|nr:hypothetical protein [Synechococcaceae cyanobacterium SM2_3_1]